MYRIDLVHEISRRPNACLGGRAVFHFYFRTNLKDMRICPPRQTFINSRQENISCSQVSIARWVVWKPEDASSKTTSQTDSE